jgi:hypothetical protein
LTAVPNADHRGERVRLDRRLVVEQLVHLDEQVREQRLLVVVELGPDAAPAAREALGH